MQRANAFVEGFIESVKRRPALYDKSSRSGVDLNALWAEVTEEVVPEYDQLNNEERLLKCKEITTRWKNLRDSFKRALNKEKANLTNPRGRKYVYFDHLSFLKPFIDDKDSSLSEPTTVCLKLEEDNYEENDLYDEEEFKLEPISTNFSSTGSTCSMDRCLKRRREEDIDEDNTFLKSLLPDMRKLNDDRKLRVKIEMLKVLHKMRMEQQEEDC